MLNSTIMKLNEFLYLPGVTNVIMSGPAPNTPWGKLLVVNYVLYSASVRIKC